MNVKEVKTKFHPNCKNIVISSSIVRTDKKEANNILKKYNNILKQEERNVIFHNSISASHLHRDGLHLNLNSRIIILAGNLLSRFRTFWHNEDSNKETNLSNDRNGKMTNSSNYKSLINDNSAIQIKSHSTNHPSLKSPSTNYCRSFEHQFY